MADARQSTFQNLIAPIREWAQKLTAADTTPDKRISASEFSALAASDALARNPTLTPAKLQAYAAQAVALREELEAALLNEQSRDPRTMLLRSIAQKIAQTGGGENIDEATLRTDLRRFMLDAKKQDAVKLLAEQGIAGRELQGALDKVTLTKQELDSTIPIAREIAQGMVALNGVQSIITQFSNKVRSVLRENQDQLPFAARDLKAAQAEDARIEAAVKADNASRITPAEILADVKRQAAASGQELSPQAEAAFTSMMREAMGPEGRAQSAKALAEGIDGMKADITKPNAAGQFAAAFGEAMNGKGGAVERGQNNYSEATQKALDGLKKRIVEPDASGRVPRGSITQAQYDEAKKIYQDNEQATGAAYTQLGQAAAREVTPQALKKQLMTMLDGAKKTILETPEQQAAKERASKTGLTVAELGAYVKERENLADFKPEHVTQPSVQQFCVQLGACPAPVAPKGR